MYKFNQDLVKLKEELVEKVESLKEDLRKAIEKGNKSAMQRVRKLSVELTKSFKELRKLSIEAEKTAKANKQQIEKQTNNKG